VLAALDQQNIEFGPAASANPPARVEMAIARATDEFTARIGATPG